MADRPLAGPWADLRPKDLSEFRVSLEAARGWRLTAIRDTLRDGDKGATSFHYRCLVAEAASASR